MEKDALVVVARKGNEVICYEDEEEGFNVSPVSADGQILEHCCNQDELRFALNDWIDDRQPPAKSGPAQSIDQVAWRARASANTLLAQRLEQIPFHSIRYLGKFLLGKPQKMWGRPVGFQARIVLVLLVDKEAARIGLVAVNDVHQAAGFFARLLRELPKERGYFAFVSKFCHPRHGQNDHRYSLRCD